MLSELITDENSKYTYPSVINLVVGGKYYIDLPGMDKDELTELDVFVLQKVLTAATTGLGKDSFVKEDRVCFDSIVKAIGEDKLENLGEISIDGTRNFLLKYSASDKDDVLIVCQKRVGMNVSLFYRGRQVTLWCNGINEFLKMFYKVRFREI